MVASKKTSVTTENPERKTFWQTPHQRRPTSEEGKRWADENAEAAEAWAKWVLENGVPLPPQF